MTYYGQYLRTIDDKALSSLAASDILMGASETEIFLSTG